MPEKSPEELRWEFLQQQKGEGTHWKDLVETGEVIVWKGNPALKNTSARNIDPPAPIQRFGTTYYPPPPWIRFQQDNWYPWLI